MNYGTDNGIVRRGAGSSEPKGQRRDKEGQRRTGGRGGAGGRLALLRKPAGKSL